MSGPTAFGPLAFVTRRPVAVTMVLVASAVFGAVSFTKLPIDLLPEISYPTLTVRTVWKGAAPEDVEQRVSERMQEALSTLPHLVRSTSVSRAEASDVVLDFEWGTAMTFSVQDVRDKLDGVFLPQGVERPLILRYDPNLDPILRIGLTLTDAAAASATDEASRERALLQLRWVAENRVKRELESIPGVAAVLVRGGLEEEIRIRVDPFKMAAQGLDPSALATRLGQENINASGGSILEGSTEFLVRTQNEFRNVAEIENLAIVRRGNAAIRVRDVATVSRTHAELEVITRLDGREAVEIAVHREAGANIVELADTVRERIFGTEEQRSFTAGLAAGAQGSPGAPSGGPRPASGPGEWQDQAQSDYLAWRLRKDARFEVLSDQSTFIRSAIDDVKSAAGMGALLAVLVIWLALRHPASTLIIGISIPVSVIVTFAPMYLADVSLNIMSLGGLALGVGMLVDSSIVVLESITRCREEGDSVHQAAIRGTREVAGAITGSTLTTVAVFAPIVFVHGIAGRIFGDQALTVVSSLLVSLVVALFLIPMLASRRWLAGAPAEGERAPLLPRGLRERVGSGSIRALHVAGGSALFGIGFGARAVGAVLYGLFKLVDWILYPFHWLHSRGWGFVERGYPRVLGAALSRPWIVILVTVAVATFAATRVGGLGLDLLPEIHQGEFTLHVGLPVGSPLGTTEAVLSDLDERTRALKTADGGDAVLLTGLTVGVEKDTLTREIEGQHTARLTVRLPPGSGEAAEEELLRRVREMAAASPAVRSVDVSRPTPFAIEAPVQIEVLGYDLEKVQEVALEVERRISDVPGLADLRTSVRAGHPEARVTFDRDKTLEYGLDLTAVSNLVRDQVLGNVSTRFSEGDDRIDIRVIGDEIQLGSLDRVLDLIVNPSSPRPVPLRDVAEVRTVEGPAEIRRIGNTRAVVVSAATTGLDLGGTSRAVEERLASLPTPDDVAVQFGGQKRELEEARSSMQFALLLALFLVYAVMASQFESLVQPLIVLVTVPLALVGVVLALEALSIPLSIIVFIGMILLAGIVVNNAIVLIDRVNQNLAAGRELSAALLEAGRTRLRPIYMTTATTVLGLLPMTGWLGLVPGLGALGAGEGAEIRAPMAITVVAGLTSSTLLTLVVIPCVFSVVYRLRRPQVRPA